MKASEVIKRSIDPSCSPGAAGALRRLAEHMERYERRQALRGDDYLSQVEDEAREIASGHSNILPAHYHLEVLIHELDQARRAAARPRTDVAPF